MITSGCLKNGNNDWPVQVVLEVGVVGVELEFVWGRPEVGVWGDCIPHIMLGWHPLPCLLLLEVSIEGPTLRCRVP